MLIHIHTFYMCMYVCGWLFITHSPPTYLQTHLNWIGQKLDLNPRGQIKAWPGDTKTSQNYFLNNSNNFQLARCIKFCPLNTKFSSQESNSTDIKIINGLPLLSTLESLIICCFTSCHHLLPPYYFPSIFSSIRVFSNESALHVKWHKYCSISFSTSPSN